MRKLKILIYTHEFIPYRAGVATYNYELAKGLCELGEEVIVLAPKYSSKNIVLDRKMPFKVFRAKLPIESTMRFNRNTLKLPITVYCLIKFIRQHNPDKILITSAVAHESAAIARLFYLFNFTLAVHGTEIFMHFTGGKLSHAIKIPLLKRLFRKAESIICVSSYTEDLLHKHVELFKEKTSVIRNGIDFKDLYVHFNKSKTQVIQKKLKLFGSKILLTVARLTPRKGHDIVINTLPEVIKKFPTIKYVIVGMGNYRKSLEKIVRDRKLSDKVIFVGNVTREELPGYYDLCDIFVMVSRRNKNTVEGLGISFLEAMSFSKPLIGGDHGGVKEVIKNGENGYLVDPLNIKSVSEAICFLLQNKELAIKMGKAGRKRLESEFSYQNMAKKTLDLLRK